MWREVETARGRARDRDRGRDYRQNAVVHEDAMQEAREFEVEIQTEVVVEARAPPESEAKAETRQSGDRSRGW